jgi:hypothetical protein
MKKEEASCHTQVAAAAGFDFYSVSFITILHDEDLL